MPRPFAPLRRANHGPHISRAPHLLQHAFPQDAVGAGLVSLAALLQPRDQIARAHGKPRRTLHFSRAGAPTVRLTLTPYKTRLVTEVVNTFPSFQVL